MNTIFLYSKPQILTYSLLGVRFMSKNSFIKNTLILIISNFVIKILGLFNRVLLTRLLGNEGISLYIICIPTIILFISFSGFSLNTAVSKVVATNNVTRKYSDKQILKKSLFIATFVSIIGMIILLLIIHPLSTKWLKQPNAYYPLLTTIIFMPLVAYNNCLRGYYNGLKKINISAYAGVIEQTSRIISSVIFLYIFSSKGIVVAVTMTMLAMSIGELIALIFTLALLSKSKLHNYRSQANPQEEILKIAIPATSSKMVGSLTYFFEPILYTLALTLIGFNNQEISFRYSEVSAYAESLLTMFSFISVSIAVAIIPHISEAFVLNDQRKIQLYIKKTLLASAIPGILFTILLFFYSSEYMHLFYKTDIGSRYVKQFAFIFIASYIINPLVAIMNSIGRAKETFIVSTICNILKLAMIFGLAFIERINYYSLMLASAISLFIVTLIIYMRLKNLFLFSFNFPEKVNVIILIILSMITIIFFKNIIHLNFLIVSGLVAILFLFSLFFLRIFHLDNK